MPLSEQTYQKVALEDGDLQWELVRGRLRCKPAMTAEHNDAIRMLDHQLSRQLDPRAFAISAAPSRLRVATGTFYISDLCVIPRAYVRRLREQPGTFEVYDRTLRAWRRQPDGSYAETVYHDGIVVPVAPPGVTITVAALFD